LQAVTEKRVRFFGLELAIATNAQNAARIRNSLPYRLIRRRLGNSTASTDPAAGPAPRSSEMPPQVKDDPDLAAAWQRVAETNWYHTIDLGHGIVSSGMVDLRPIAGLVGLPDDLTGKRVLDVGTCDGFWAFEMERRGASEVVALDIDSYDDYDVPRIRRLALREHGDAELGKIGLQPVGEPFRLAREIIGSRVKREVVNVYDLSPEKVGTFDLVFCGYLLVHLRDAATALENIFSVTKDLAIVVEPIAPDLEGFMRPLSSFVRTFSLGIWWEHNSITWKRMMAMAGFDPIEEVSRSELAFDIRGPQPVLMHTLALRGHKPGAQRSGK
jgi:tRNA (mo5U34)-methyltransferase